MSIREQKVIEELLGDEYTKTVLQELGIQNSAPAVQTELLGHLGSNIMKRLALEILTVLPKSEHAQFERLMGSNDTTAMRALVEAHVPDFDAFIAHHANMEYEATKTQIHQLQQGVE